MGQIVVVSILIVLMLLLVPLFSHLLARWPRLLKTGKWAMLAVYVLAAVYLTLFSRAPRIYHHMRLMPFWSYIEAIQLERADLVEEIILNMMLFVPMGYLVQDLFPKLKPLVIIVIAVLCSGMIESVQLFAKLGLCEVDDVISNTAGAALGMGAWRVTDWLLKRREGRGQSLPKA